MSEMRSRPRGRFFCGWNRQLVWLLAIALTWMIWLTALLNLELAHAQTPPATTLISDTIFRADGTPAQGVLLISWGPFTTAAGAPVAAGNLSATLGTGGALHVSLVSNVGATPSSTYYTVVYQLDDGAVRTEFWMVPATSPATLAVVRATPGTGTTAALASRQYVDSAVAGKASDNVVVHLGGAETIAGTKQFTVPPSVPAPAASSDAANKAYVDQAVSAVGAGAFVAKTGDTMSGPLNLPGDPLSSNSASDKHYVDITAAGKASLVGGVVPPAQLGSGAANGTLCLKGDSSWGACGTGTNAVSIQNVPVATTAPSDGQVVTFDGASGQYKPKTGASANATSLQGTPLDTTAPSDGQAVTFNAAVGKYQPKAISGALTSGMQAVKYATDFAWTQSPATDLSAPGAKTVALAACLPGVTGTEPQYYVYVTGTGTAEAALITGGTCSGNGAAGTLQFTTVNAHPSGYVIKSASSGLQEASIAARWTNSTSPTYTQGGKVIAPPGEFKIYAPVSILTVDQTIDFSGSMFECWVPTDSCIKVGYNDPAKYNWAYNITLINPRGRATQLHGTQTMIAIYGQKTRIYNLLTMPGVNLGGGNAGTFGSYLQVVADQAFLLDGVDSAWGGGIECNSTQCGTLISAPGPFGGPSNAAVGWIKHAQISLQCTGNGIDWQSGNTLRISDSVIQGYSQFGVRGGNARGGYGMIAMENVYMEDAGTCTNPIGNVGTAGVLVQGGKIEIRGGEGPAGTSPLFANDTGGTQYDYYIVANSTTYGSSNPLYAGSEYKVGSGNVTITTPDIAGATSYDLPKTPHSGYPYQSPFGTGNYAIAVGVSHTTCAAGLCTFTDPNTTLASYTVPAVPTYFPLLTYWPGPLVLSSGADSSSQTGPSTAYVTLNNNLPNGHSQVGYMQVNELGAIRPSILSQDCLFVQGSPLWQSCLAAAAAPVQLYEQSATILAVKPNNDGGLRTNMKGRLNFSTVGTGPGHIITLADSNFAKTVATLNGRPPNDAGDAYIGYDQGGGSSGVGISIGAPLSISEYIGNVGDGTSFLERLTAGAKVFNVPVTINGNLAVTGTCTAAGVACGGAGSGLPAGGTSGQVLAKVNSTDYNTQWVNQSGGSSNSDSNTPPSGTYTINGNQTVTGNVTVNGTLATAGPMLFSGPWPSSTPTPSAANNSTWGVDANGRVGQSVNGGAFADFLTSVPIATVQVNGAAVTPSSGAINIVGSGVSSSGNTITIAGSGGSAVSGIDVSGYSGISLCAKVKAARAANPTANLVVANTTMGGMHVCPAADLAGMLDGATGSTDATLTGGGGLYLDDGVGIALDGPAGGYYSENGSGAGTPAILLPDKFEGLMGSGPGAGATNSISLSLIIPCAGAGSPVSTSAGTPSAAYGGGPTWKAPAGEPGCTTGFPQRSFGITSTSLGTAGGQTALVITPSTPFVTSGASASLVTQNEPDAILGATGAPSNNDMYLVQDVCTGNGTSAWSAGYQSRCTANGQLEVVVDPSVVTAACASNCGNAVLGTAAIGFYPGSGNPTSCVGSGCAIFRAQVRDLGFDSQNIPGFIAVENRYGQEQTQTSRLQVQNNNFIGVLVDKQSQNSGPYESFEIYSGGTACGTHTTGFFLGGGNSPTNRGLNGITVNAKDAATTYPACSGKPRAAVRADSSGVEIKGLHSEYFSFGVLAGANKAVNSLKVSNVQSGITGNYQETGYSASESGTTVTFSGTPIVNDWAVGTAFTASGGSIAGYNTTYIVNSTTAATIVGSNSTTALGAATGCILAQNGTPRGAAEVVKVSPVYSSTSDLSFELIQKTGSSSSPGESIGYTIGDHVNGNLIPDQYTSEYTCDKVNGHANCRSSSAVVPVQMDAQIPITPMTQSATGYAKLGLDSDGNWKISENGGALSSIATDNAVVHVAGTETVTGAKTFSQPILTSTGGPMLLEGTKQLGTSVTLDGSYDFGIFLRSDNTLGCQLSGGGSCMPSGGGMIYPGAGVPNSTGSAWGASYTVGTSANNLVQLNGSGQLPALSAANLTSFPTLNQNTTGTAANLSGTPALPSGTSATTQSAGDNSSKLATTAYVKSEVYLVWTCSIGGSTSVSNYCGWTIPAGITITSFDISSPGTLSCTTYPVYQVWDRNSATAVGSFSITATSTGSVWSYTGTANPTIGHGMAIRVTTAAVGCTPTSINASVTYQMQN